MYEIERVLGGGLGCWKQLAGIDWWPRAWCIQMLMSMYEDILYVVNHAIATIMTQCGPDNSGGNRC